MSANRYDSFLKAVLGNDGAGALIKATEQVEDLSGALVPRTILAWLGTKPDGHDGSIPGTSSYFAFAKSESGYVGAAEVGSDIYTFEKADLNTVAAHLAVSLGVDMSKAVALKHVQAERLGRSIDLLAKSQSAKMAVQPLVKMAMIHQDANTPKMVYRVMNANKEGPHTSGAEIPSTQTAYSRPHSPKGFINPDAVRPPPVQRFGWGTDGGTKPMDITQEEKEKLEGGGHLFGFEHPYDAVRWFGDKGMDSLHKQGYHLYAVPASTVYRSVSGRQVMFEPHHSYNQMSMSPISKEAYLQKPAPSMLKSDKGAEAPGPAHAPTQPGGPSKPTAPTPTQPNIPKPAAPKAPPLKTNPVPPLKPIKVKLPGKKLPGLSITKSESLRSCSICGTRQFSGSSFVGCTCLSSLAKSVSVASTPSGYNLSFSGEWDRESILSLAKILGVR